MLDTLLPVLLFAALALAVLGAAKRFLMWRRGRPAKVDWIGGLLQMPRRYLVDLHHVVERDRYMSRTHVATAGGFVLAALLAILVHGFGLHGRILGFALLAATALMFVGALFVARRRLDPPSRLSKGPWMRLPKSLLAFAASFFLATLPVAGIPAGRLRRLVPRRPPRHWRGLGRVELFLGMTWGGPMKHAFAGALHLAWHRRAELRRRPLHRPQGARPGRSAERRWAWKSPATSPGTSCSGSTPACSAASARRCARRSPPASR
ncbi:DUF3483 domain-containing protein [Pseudomonas aeruginosa]|nr:DUF3483 domain-containing protein [Pseudomonas aeruginosa]